MIETGFSKVPYIYKTSGIFGANASGKTNVLKALAHLKSILSMGATTKSEDKLPSDYYLFSKGYDEKPTSFKIIFLKNSKLYDYEISLLNGLVVKESAFFSDFSEEGSKRRKCIFSRERNDDGKYDFSVSKGIKNTWTTELLPQRVFLSDLINNRNTDRDEIRDIYEFFRKDIVVIGNKSINFSKVLHKIADNAECRKYIIEFTKNADFGLENISVKVQPLEDFLKQINFKEVLENDKQKEFFNQVRPMEAKTYHNTEEGGTKETELIETESEGTKMYLAISDSVLTALKAGKVLFIDELDESLHPFLVRNLVDLFNRNDTGAQLIFTSHAHYLMDGETLTRDQIWFTSKENGFYTDLYPLSDFGDKRIDLNFYKSYLRGIYGAVPRIMES
ncbi:MAG: ATP/GTP-binding protein [Alphaproteobacteria bacterium]